jgi:hypothetical protein
VTRPLITAFTEEGLLYLLWVLLDNDAVFSGMPIPELADEFSKLVMRP